MRASGGDGRRVFCALAGRVPVRGREGQYSCATLSYSCVSRSLERVGSGDTSARGYKQAGADVHFVARGAHLAAMRTSGLLVESQLGDLHLPRVSATDNPADIGVADMVWLSVKLWDMDSAVRSMRPLVGPGTGIISFQNGVQKDDILRAAFGDNAVMGGVAYIATNIDRPGVIKHTGTMQRLIFGEYDGSRSARAETLLGPVPPRRHQRGAERGRPQGDLGEVRLPRRPLRLDDHDARDDRPDSIEPAGAAVCSQT